MGYGNENLRASTESSVQAVRAALPMIERQLGRSSSAQPPQSSSTGLAAELEALMGLKNQGVLSEGEFAAAKAKLLGI